MPHLSLLVASPLYFSRNFSLFYFFAMFRIFTTLKYALGKILKAIRALGSKLQTQMDLFPLACLFALGVVSGFSIAGPLQLIEKTFILSFPLIVISLIVIVYKFIFGRK
jgi:hypothetical protein